MRTLTEDNQVYVVIPREEHGRLVANQLTEEKVDSLSQADIETRLGYAVDYAAWLDAYLMAESLQENFAHVIAGFTHLTIAEENQPHPNTQRLTEFARRSRHCFQTRDTLFQLSLREKQLVLINLMLENIRQQAAYTDVSPAPPVS